MLVAGIVSAGEALLKWGNSPEAVKKQWNDTKFKVKKINEAPGNGLCIIVNKCTWDTPLAPTTAGFIPVEADKKYILSGYFRSTGKELSKLFFGFIPYDAKKKEISSFHTNVIPNTGSELTANAYKGDKSVMIRNGMEWRINLKNPKSYAIAFNVKDDFSDLPNRESQYGLVKVIPKGDVFKIELSKPLNKDYPIGTKVREHSIAYGKYLYTAACGVKVPKEWKEYKGTCTMGKPGRTGWNLFRPGTAFVKILLLANYGQKADAEMQVANIELKEAD